MRKNRVGRSDIFISPLSLGCMSLPLENMKLAEKIVNYALERGINHLDTADLYQFGENEKIIGNIVKNRREEVVLTTKVGNHFDKDEKTWYWDPTKQYIKQAVEASLKRLGTDYIDLYLLHGGTIDDPIDETIEAFEELKQAGTIRAYGISSIRPNVIKEYVKKSNIDVVMMQYNMLDRRPESLFDLLQKNKISVLARGPLAKGLLSEQAEHYINKKGKDGYLAYTQNELYETIQKIQLFNEPLAKLALQYILNSSPVISAVFGVSTLAQLEENLNYMNELSMNECKLEKIKKLTKSFYYNAHV
ncbi:aldo/keto reductase [Pseudogracilibacillus sp. SE30717A]|uniref:aldo/keto reductase n=1 Tax=Pseudogracilibacillus sp. SE30717A TaxID=3098293 RepID=UPI00300E239E